MREPLTSQMHDYFAYLDEEQGAIDLETIRSDGAADFVLDGTPQPAARSRRTRPRWGLLVAGAAVVVLFGGMALLLVDSGGTGAPSASTSPTVVPTTVAPTTVPLVVPGWSRVSDDGGVFGGRGNQAMTDVVVAGPGFVAVGRDGVDAGVWTSVDGSVWSRVPHDETVFGDASIGGVATNGNVIVAVGTGEKQDLDRSFAIVWTSPDGISWTRVVDRENVFGDTSIADVTVGGPGFVAVGSTTYKEGDEQDQSDAVVWTSVDGQFWSRVAHDESVFGGNGQGMSSVTVGGPGLVAVGWEGRFSAVWTSFDGLVWSRVADDASVFGEYMASVTAGGPGLVAVGYALGCRPVWTSVDGLVWSRVPEDVPGACTGWMSSVIVDGERLVAVGPGGISWSSVDGFTWTLMPDDLTTWRDLDPELRFTYLRDGQGMSSVTASNVGLVAVGSVEVDPTDPSLREDAAVWLQE